MMRPRGSALIAVLLLLVVLLILGMAFLTQQSLLYRASSQAQLSVAARAIAEAGLEDARGKLEKDLDFPPDADPDQKIFTYTEVLTDITDTREIGQYAVTVDFTNRTKNGIISITSVGTLAGDTNARRILYAELDVSDDLATNPNFFRYAQFEDRGGL
jgi:type II secretory pathway pseudopilin PulG